LEQEATQHLANKKSKPKQVAKRPPFKPTIRPVEVRDTTPPSIEIASAITVSVDSPTIRGRVFDNDKIARLTAAGRAVDLQPNGSFSFSRYVPVGGTTVRIEAVDEWGNRSERTINITRVVSRATDQQTFASLDPTKIKGRPNRNAIALIVGVANYARAPSADYADKDAQVFSDYARRALGVPRSNIKLLVNGAASRTELKLGLKHWLRGRIEANTDVYVFFAGHGLASSDGKDLYLLPANGVPTLLEDTAILRSDLFNVISKAKPRSATLFMDTCYSGITRSKETLLASARPVV
jgi:hypothetical protein